jgi:anti-sigma-K factor RskA
MNTKPLLRALLAAARAQAPSDHVPYAFERRIMARLRATPMTDGWTYWSRMLWRATAPCLAITLALALWTLFTAPANGVTAPSLEDTVFAAVQLNGE